MILESIEELLSQRECLTPDLGGKSSTQEVGRAILKKVGLEGEYEGIGNCIIGYADMTPQEKPRKENRVYYI